MSKHTERAKELRSEVPVSSNCAQTVMRVYALNVVRNIIGKAIIFMIFNIFWKLNRKRIRLSRCGLHKRIRLM